MDECSLCGSSSRSDIGQKRESFYVQCSSCGLIRISPHPTDEQLVDYYQNYLDRGRAANPKKKRLRALIRAWFLRRLAPGNKFLEIGCNVGSMVNAARRVGCEGVGIDVSPAAIAIAQERWPECRFYNEPIEIFAERGEKFDIVFCTEVIEHIKDLHAFMSAFSKVLNPNAIVFFTTPDAGHFSLRNKDLLTWRELRPTQHLAIFNRSNFEQLFRKYDFSSFYFVPMHRANLRVFTRKKSK